MKTRRVIDLGYYTTKNGHRYLLSWHDDGQLLFDGELVAWIPTETEVRRRLDGWYDHCDRPDALTWLAARLEGAR